MTVGARSLSGVEESNLAGHCEDLSGPVSLDQLGAVGLVDAVPVDDGVGADIEEHRLCAVPFVILKPLLFLVHARDDGDRYGFLAQEAPDRGVWSTLLADLNELAVFLPALSIVGVESFDRPCCSLVDSLDGLPLASKELLLCSFSLLPLSCGLSRASRTSCRSATRRARFSSRSILVPSFICFSILCQAPILRTEQARRS